MIVYEDKNLLNDASYNILKKLGFFESLIIRKFWYQYLEEARLNERVIGSPKFREERDNLNPICIRMNKEISFNIGEYFYNDILIVYKSIGAFAIGELYIYKVTADPKGKKDNIAHLLEGVYDSYVIRNHAWTPGRIAFGQDRNEVMVGRTDVDGNLKRLEPYFGFFGINVHDSSKYQNSSLGCTVLQPDKEENNFHFEKSYKPLLKSATNKNEVSYLITNYMTVHNFLLKDFTTKDLKNKPFAFYANKILI